MITRKGEGKEMKKHKTIVRAARRLIWLPIAASVVVLVLNTFGITHYNQFQLAMLANLLVLGRCAMGFED